MDWTQEPLKNNLRNRRYDRSNFQKVFETWREDFHLEAKLGVDPNMKVVGNFILSKIDIKFVQFGQSMKKLCSVKV